MREGIINIIVWWCDVCVKIWSPVVDKFVRSHDDFMGR